ncbi:ubiquitin-conjugating enzyme/RWD-like protein, partial [Gaertneriomyces semiglobifer]
QERLDLAKTPVPNASVAPENEEDPLKWKGTLTGPEASAFKGGVFCITMEFPTDYPFKPPKVLFQTKIYHPNVDDDGSVCLATLKTEVWKPSTKISDVLTALVDLLENPVPEDPLRPAIAEIYQQDRAQFNKTAKEWVKKYC